MSLEELIRACADPGDESVWKEFVRRFHPLIAGVALRTAQRWGNASPALVDDLIQETYLKLCSGPSRLLAVFDANAPDAFYGYLKVVTTNVVHDYFRAMHSRKRDVQQEEPLETTYASATAREGNPDYIEQSVLIGEVKAVLEQVTSGKNQQRDCTIFWLRHRQGMTPQAIAQLPGFDLSVKGVESLLLRLTRQVRERLAEPRHPIGT